MPEREFIDAVLKPALKDLSDINLVKVHKMLQTADIRTLYKLLGCLTDDLKEEVERRKLNV